MSIGLLTLHLRFPGCASLKEKRSHLKPLLARLHRQFNISVAEIGAQDSWTEAIVACALVSNAGVQTRRALQEVVRWTEHHFPDIEILEDRLELI